MKNRNFYAKMNLLALILCGGLKSKAQSLILNFDSLTSITTPAVYDNDSISIRHTIRQTGIPTFNRYASFKTTKFVTDARFNDGVFAENSDFSGGQFLQETDFSNSAFQGECDFKSEYMPRVDPAYTPYLIQSKFLPAVFHGDAKFQQATFENKLSFIDALFKNKVDFSLSIFNDETYFEYVGFQENADFRAIQCNKMLNFTSCKFDNGLDLSVGHFKYGINFLGSSFHGMVKLRALYTADTAIIVFYEVKLPDLVDFSGNLNLKNQIDFSVADFDSSALYKPDVRRWHYINIAESNISKIKMDYQHFRLCFFSPSESDLVIVVKGANVVLDNKIFPMQDSEIYKQLLTNRNFCEYLQELFPNSKVSDSVVTIFVRECLNSREFPRRLSQDEKTSIYEHMLKNFDLEGQKVSYQALDIEYKDFQNGWFVLPHYWNCYGYHKEWIFIWSIIIILLLTAITFRWLPILNRAPEIGGVYYIANIPIVYPVKNIYDFVRRLWFSLMYTTTIFFLFGLKIENMNFRRLGLVYVIFIYSIGILCLGYIANFVLQK